MNGGVERENNLRQKLNSRFKRETSLNLLTINIEEHILRSESKAMESSDTSVPTDGIYWNVIQHAYEIQQKNKTIEQAFKLTGGSLDTDSSSESDDDDDSNGESDSDTAKNDAFPKETKRNVRKHGSKQSSDKNGYVKSRFVDAVVERHLTEHERKRFERASKYYRVRHKDFVYELPKRITNAFFSFSAKTLKFYRKLMPYQQTNFLYSYIQEKVFTRRTVRIMEMQFHRTRQLPHQTPGEYLGHLEKMRKLLVSHNRKIKDVDIIDKLLDGLEIKYRIPLTQFYHQDRTLEDYKKHINDLEQLYNAANSSSKRKREGQNNDRPLTARDHKRPKFGSSSGSSFGPSCYHCNQPGHKRPDCPLLKEQNGHKGKSNKPLKIAGVRDEIADGSEDEHDNVDSVIAALNTLEDEDSELANGNNNFAQDRFSDSD